jgi:hypothetical protein
VRDAREEPVEQMEPALRREGHHVVRDADRRMRHALADDRRGRGVRGHHVVERAGHRFRIGDRRRDLRVEIAGEQKDERLVERDVKADAISERLDDARCE